MTAVVSGFLRTKDKLVAQGRELGEKGKVLKGLIPKGKGGASGTAAGSELHDEPAANEKEAEQWRRRASTMSARSHHEPLPLHPYHSRFLQASEDCVCCRCAKRWQLAILANIGFIIVFGIRCNFGAARARMTENVTDDRGNLLETAEFHWGPTQFGFMESSFFYGYLITQLPGGFLAAKFAPNKLFGLAIGGASFLNIFMPEACESSVFLVCVVQMLMGLIQGVSYPAMHGVWRYWAPPLERSKLATTAFTGSYAGAVVGLPLSAWLVRFSWRTPFYVYGIAGLIWTVVWFLLTFERPAMHPMIQEEEKRMIEKSIGRVSHTPLNLFNVPWLRIWTSMPVWAIIVANFARSWTFYLLLNHQITFMTEKLEFKEGSKRMGFWAAFPHAVMALMVLIGGRIADYLRSNNIMSTTNVRKLMNCGGFGGEAFFLLFVGYASGPYMALISLVLAVGSSGFAISGFNVNHLDIAPRYASLLMGISNGFGTFSGMICPFVTEQLRTHEGIRGWKTVFLLASMIHFTGVVFYAIFASGEQQDWAEPPDEMEPAIDDFQAKALHAGYGSTRDAVQQIAQIPDADELMAKAKQRNGAAPTYDEDVESMR